MVLALLIKPGCPSAGCLVSHRRRGATGAPERHRGYATGRGAGYDGAEAMGPLRARQGPARDHIHSRLLPYVSERQAPKRQTALLAFCARVAARGAVQALPEAWCCRTPPRSAATRPRCATHASLHTVLRLSPLLSAAAAPLSCCGCRCCCCCSACLLSRPSPCNPRTASPA